MTSESWENSFSKWFKMVGIFPEMLYYIIFSCKCHIKMLDGMMHINSKPQFLEFLDSIQFHIYYRYFGPVCQEIVILFSSTHGMDFYNTYIYSQHWLCDCTLHNASLISSNDRCRIGKIFHHYSYIVVGFRHCKSCDCFWWFKVEVCMYTGDVYWDGSLSLYVKIEECGL